LTEDEELKKQANYCLENYVWMATKPGIGTNFSSATLDGYPRLITDFSATQRDLANIHGVRTHAYTVGEGCAGKLHF
jgi:hypothetical protein